MNFIDSAYERFTKTSPELVKYISSFVDLTSEVPEEYGVELGVFMLIVGPSLLYVPVVSKGGTVFPVDCVYSTTENQFFPLTPKFIDKIVSANEMSLGEKTTIPANVIKNPNVRELIEPPKTGKFAYAGSRLPEFLYQLSDGSKKILLDKIASDSSFGKGLHNLGFNLSDIKDVLSKPVEKVAEHRPVQINIRVVTEGNNLPDTVIQEILQRGYGFVGYNSNPTFAVEYDARNDGYTTLENAQPGKVYEVIMADGSSKVGFVPPSGPSLQETSDGFSTKNNDTGAAIIGGAIGKANTPVNKSTMVIFEDGSYASGEKFVIRATTLGTLDDIILHLAESGAFKKAKEIPSKYEKIMIVTKNGWMGPFTVDRVSSNETGTHICARGWDGDKVDIHESENMHGDLLIKGREIFVNNNAAFMVLGGCTCDVEKDVAVASTKRSMIFHNHMAPVRIAYDGVEFSLNGKPIGSEPNLARELVERKGLDKQAFEVFVDKARTNGKVDIFMSKEAAMGAGPDYQTLPPNMPGSQMTPPHDNDPAIPQVNNKSLPQTGPIQQSMGTGDQSIVESTIISEFLNDPNMFDTISTYLPVIKEAIDKLGRSIFLIRLNIGNITQSIEPDYLSTLSTSLRNTFKMLGDSYLRLDSLTNTSLVQDTEL